MTKMSQRILKFKDFSWFSKNSNSKNEKLHRVDKFQEPMSIAKSFKEGFAEFAISISAKKQ